MGRAARKGGEPAADARVSELARRQHGVFARSQARSLGMTEAMLRYRVRSGRWDVVDSGVYRISGTPDSWHQRLAAACLAGPAVASHRSAGVLWRFPCMPDAIIEVSALRHRRRRASDVIWHESYLLFPDQITEIEGIQTTNALRTVLDLACVLRKEDLEVVCNEGIRRGLFTAFSALAMIERFGPQRPGSSAARALFEARCSGDRLPESVLETRFLQLVRAAGLPLPISQFEIAVASRRFRVDFAYPEIKLAIELDGDAFHWGERAQRRDRDRDSLLGTVGWHVQRFTSRDVDHREHFVVQILKPWLAQIA